MLFAFGVPHPPPNADVIGALDSDHNRNGISFSELGGRADLANPGASELGAKAQGRFVCFDRDEWTDTPYLNVVWVFNLVWSGLEGCQDYVFSKRPNLWVKPTI